MVTTFDLAALAEDISTPYRPVPLATLDGLEAALFICQGARGWNRLRAHDQLLIVVEGVITLQSQQHSLVVGEGEVASAPRDVSHHIHSGMRSAVVLLEGTERSARRNGHRDGDRDGHGALVKVNAALDARAGTPFEWLEAGQVTDYTLSATRLQGASLPYTTPPGGFVLLVYRGVLDYACELGRGTVVGSQMVSMPAGQSLQLSSERGATVLAITRSHATLPRPSGAAASDEPSTG